MAPYVFSYNAFSQGWEEGGGSVWVLMAVDVEVLGILQDRPGKSVNGYKCTGTDKIAEAGAIHLPSL